MQKEESKDMVIFALVFIAILVVAGIFMFKNGFGTKTTNPNQIGQNQDLSSEQPVQKPTETTPTPTPPVSQKPTGKYTKAEMVLEKGKQYQAILKTTKGDITLDLYADKTPITVNNFVFLAKDKFYDGTKFHRVIKDFMIQGGDPLGTGMGGPGYSFNDEPFTGDYTAGTLAMAKTAQPNTNGSQFFIMQKDNFSMQKDYIIFGKVADEKSRAVVNTIAQVPVQPNSQGEDSTPVQDVLINSVEIVTK